MTTIATSEARPPAGTVVPEPAPADHIDRPRPIGRQRSSDLLALAGVAAPQPSPSPDLLFGRLAPFSGAVGMVIVGYLALPRALRAAGLAATSPVRRSSTGSWLRSSTRLGLVLLACLVLVIGFVLLRGFTALPAPELLHPGPQQGRAIGAAHGGREPARHRRHAGADHHRPGDHRTAGAALRGVPQRGPRGVRAVRPHHRRGDDGAAVDRRRPVHLRHLHPGAGLRQVRPGGRARSRRDDAADHHPGCRRGDPTRSWQSAGGVSGAGRRTVANGRARGAADRAIRV